MKSYMIVNQSYRRENNLAGIFFAQALLGASLRAQFHTNILGYFLFKKESGF